MIKEIFAMSAPKSLDPAGLLRGQLESASPDLLRQMVKTLADALMSAEADAICGAAYDEGRGIRTHNDAAWRSQDNRWL